MSSEESDDIDSIIPEIALSAALNGKEQRLIRKRRKPADLGEDIIESSPEKKTNACCKRKSSNGSQTSIENYLLQNIDSSRWIPVHKKPVNTERRIRKKVINIDEDDGPKSGSVSAVVQEVQSDFDEEDMSETVKLSKNIQKARRKSIVNYFPQIKNKDKNGTTLRNFMSHEKNSTDDSLTIDVNEDEVKQAAELYTEGVTDQSATNIKTREYIEEGAMISAEREVFNEVEGHEVEDHYVKLEEHYMEEPQVNCLISPVNMGSAVYPNIDRLRSVLNKGLLEYDTEPNLDRPNEDLDMCYVMTNTINKDVVPQPYPKICADSILNFGIRGFVRLPWSTGNVYKNYHCYAMIEKALRTLSNNEAYNIHAVVTTIQECAPWVEDCSALVSFSENLSESDRSELLRTMTGIANLALRAKYLINAPLQILKRGSCRTVTLSQEQCACLLANAFFCTYRKESFGFNAFNMAGLFSIKNELSFTKLRFILHYFSTVLRKMPTGCISFRRLVVSPHKCPDWEIDNRELTSLAIISKGSIEETFGCLQMDFANKYIGGGVMNSGAVQEEIRFLICPEMLISCLLCEWMDDHEAIIIVGAQRYSSYTGYGSTLQWAPYEDYGKEPVDKFGRIKCEVVAVDALCFGWGRLTYSSQYDQVIINRELNKAFAGFYSTQKMCRPIATGHWGCGAFGGDKQLKSLIQIMAAACARRDVIYYTFNDLNFENSLDRVYRELIKRRITIGELYSYLVTYQSNCEDKVSVFDYVMNQMTINST